jgi:N-carbamoylputrescine amidase
MSIKVAITQFSMSEVYDENLAKADSLIAKATSKGAQLVLLPELFEGHYFCQVENYDNFGLAEDRRLEQDLEAFRSGC